MASTAATSTAAGGDATSNQGARVLVVISDDDVRARAVSALGLRRDLDVTAVTSIADARELLEGVDVLVVDGDLRPKGGYSWLYQLREEADLAGTTRPPALVLTDRTDDLFLVHWSSADAWIEKPVDPFALARTVARLAATTAAA